MRDVRIVDNEVVTADGRALIMHLSVQRYGEAIRAAFEQGYVDGNAHPRDRRVIERARECAAGFWSRVVAAVVPVSPSLSAVREAETECHAEGDDGR